MRISLQSLESLAKWADGLAPIACTLEIGKEGIIFHMLAPATLFPDNKSRGVMKIAPWSFIIQEAEWGLGKVADHVEAEIRYKIDKEGRPRPTTKRRVV